MSSLPADEVDGTNLPAGFLNQILAARYGNITPVDPITRTASDNLHDNGAAAFRWKDGHFGGKINADGQNIMRARPIAQTIDTSGITIDWAAPLTNVGTAISVSGAENFLLNEAGIYLITCTLATTLSISFAERVVEVEIRQERPITTFLDQWKRSFSRTGGSVLKTGVQTIVIAQSADAIEVRASISIGTAGITLAESDINIIRLY